MDVIICPNPYANLAISLSIFEIRLVPNAF